MALENSTGSRNVEGARKAALRYEAFLNELRRIQEDFSALSRDRGDDPEGEMIEAFERDIWPAEDEKRLQSAAA